MPWSFEDGDPYQRIVRDVVARQSGISAAECGKEIVDIVELAAQQGEQWAMARVRQLADEKATDHAAAEIRRQGRAALVWKPSARRAVNMALNIGVVARREDGTRENWTQRRLLVEVSREEAVEWMRTQQSVHATYDMKVSACVRYFRIWDEHPDAATIREACALAGVDPFTILAEEDQVIS